MTKLTHTIRPSVGLTILLAAVIAVGAARPSQAQSGPGFVQPGPGFVQSAPLQSQAPVAGLLEQMAPIERQDFGVPPTDRLHGGPMHGPTPASIPGGQLITTQGLVALMQGRQLPFVVVDVLGQMESLPGATAGAWLAQPGTYDDRVQQQARQMLGQLTQGRKDVPLIFYCLSRECWMSYNAALRAIQAGYGNVLWYRGGLEAWKAAGQPTQTTPMTNPATLASPGSPPGRPVTPAIPERDGRSTFTAVSPLPPASTRTPRPAQAAEELRISQGRYFSFALPSGWRVAEEAQFVVSLVAPDNLALTLLVGNAGMPIHHSAAQYASTVLAGMRPQNLQLGAPRPARPMTGFSQAIEFDVRFQTATGMSRGIAKVSEAPAYDTKTMAMTAALAAVEQWPGYSTWLPMVAEQAAAIDGAAFGRRGVMQQNLATSRDFGEATRRYREWSQKTWQGVVDDRNRGNDRRNAEFRENLGAVQTYSSPFGITTPVELPTTHKHYWQDRQGNYVGTDDPRADPNMGSTVEWRRMAPMAR